MKGAVFLFLVLALAQKNLADQFGRSPFFGSSEEIDVVPARAFSPDDSEIKRFRRMVNAQDNAEKDCECGTSDVGPTNSNRIIGGKEVNPPHSRPYQAYLESCPTSPDNCYFICGGTLINKRYVITAMHCIVSKARNPSFKISLGMHGLDDKSPPAKVFNVRRIIKREDYQPGTVDNDIAILELAEDVEFNSAIRPACLPADDAKDYAGVNAVVSGWGKTETEPASNVLLEATVKVLQQNDSSCSVYAKGRGLPVLPNDQMCAASPDKDSCTGDSGGPLVIKDADERFTLIGVVSYGSGCATPGFAGVYARVTNFLSWINDNVADGWCESRVTPTTLAPTSDGPTTVPPTTKDSTSVSPTTEGPTSEGPTSEGPTSEGPSSESPTSITPITEDPTSVSPITEGPTSIPPTTEDPTSVPPTTEGTTSILPTTKDPTYVSQTTEDPTTKPSTTTTSAHPNGPSCDLSCHFRYPFRVNGYHMVRGIKARCQNAVCQAIDGSDLCHQLRLRNCRCDLRCLKWPLPAWSAHGFFTANGIKMQCSYALCWALDGSNLCEDLGQPCWRHPKDRKKIILHRFNSNFRG